MTFPLVRVAAGVKSSLSLEKMNASHTVSAENLILAEKETGSLKVGKRTDLVVLSQNLVGLAPEDIEKTQAVMTMFGGTVTYAHSTLNGNQAAKVIVAEQEDGNGH